MGTTIDQSARDSSAASRAGSFPELSEQLERDLVQIFRLLADETRIKILMYLLRERELHVSALCDRLNQSQPAVSHHLALLRVAGLIEPRRDGKQNFYSVREKHFHKLIGELFKTFSESERDEIRFSGFVLSDANFEEQSIEPKATTSTALLTSAQLVSIKSESTQQRRVPKVNIDELDEMMDLALDLLGTEAAARSWLKTPQKSLGDVSPWDLASQPGGVAKVRRELQRLEHGVYS